MYIFPIHYPWFLEKQKDLLLMLKNVMWDNLMSVFGVKPNILHGMSFNP
jgi:hypothetical protein